jgi:hypothetical protein
MAEETEGKGEGSGTSGEDLGTIVSDIPQFNDASKIKFAGESDTDEEKEEEEEEKEEDEKDGDSGKEGAEGDGNEEEEGAEEEGAAGAKDKAGDAGKQTAEKREYSLDEFVTSVDSMITKVSGGVAKNLNDVKAILADNKKLKDELAAAPKEPKFVNEKAKTLFEYANKAAGLELESARQFLQVVALGDVNKLSDKDAQLEAFLLTRPDLTRERGTKVFEADYDERYTDLENNLLQQDRHGVATRDAKAKLADLQKQFTDAKGDAPKGSESEDPKASQEILDSIEAALPEFGGLSLSLGENDDEVLNLPLNEAEEAEFKEILNQPLNFIRSIIDSCMDDKGNFDSKAWMSEMFTLFKAYKGDLSAEIYKLGKTNGAVGLANDRKNIKNGKDKHDAPRSPKKSFEETMVEAVSSRR